MLRVDAIRVGGLCFADALSRSGIRYAFENPFYGYGVSVPVSGNFVFKLGRRESAETDGLRSAIFDSSRVDHASFSRKGAWRRISISTNDIHERVRDMAGVHVHVRGRLDFALSMGRQSHVLRLALCDSMRATEFIHENARRPIQLKDIAEAAGVSARSLQLYSAKRSGKHVPQR